MFRNYFKTAWRNLLKHKFYAFINIAGLTTGLTVGLLILLWVRDEMSFDSFHRKADSIYKLQCWGGTGTSRQVWTDIISPMGILAKQQLPEVTDVVRITYNGYYSQYQYKNKTFSDDVAVFVDPSFFSVFDFPLIAGNNAKPFSDDHAVVITRKIAEKYFGQEDPIGKVIIADGKESFTVTGVINNFPHNSSMRYDMMMPMSLKAQWLIKDHRDINT
ncbi:MAG TPA: ABC transporter permease, partial [Chitinophaga sp.]|uniref:ABC transporter permease n=1 Tax=Chitinophaga sp. TaxID=1869181 RepID=UPI002D0836FF